MAQYLYQVKSKFKIVNMLKMNKIYSRFTLLFLFFQFLVLISKAIFIIQLVFTYPLMQVKLFLLLAVIWIAESAYRAPPYAEWAHSHVVWLNRDLKKDTELYEMVRKYKQNGIPVGGVNIDSTWSECINNFVFDRKKFPNPQAVAPYFHAQGIKVILWATSVINKECPEYSEGVSKGYFLNSGKTIHWWHGEGAFVDFFNPSAKKWFHSLLDRALDLGFDGWKCDGTDPMIYLLRPMPYSSQLKRYVRYREYADQYYGTFYNYTKSRNPDALIMSRPVDSFQSKFFLGYSPKYVMFAGWVGDQHNTVDGFRAAMINVIHSASRGYLNFGFDIGGYKSDKQTKKWLFIRWVQLGSLLPFMQNGGGGQHQPWDYDQQTVDLYRKSVLLHYDLKEFFLTAGTQAFNAKKAVIEPLIKDKRVIQFTKPDNLGYILYGTFLVEPIFDENGYVQVIFPKGHNWLYFFNRNLSFQGTGVKQSMSIPLHQTPLFVRDDNVFPFAGELWLVKLRQGERKQSVIGGDYSDEVTIKLQGTVLNVTVNRFYKNQEIRAKRQGQKLRVRLIGMGKPQSKQVQSTQYPDQFYITLNYSILNQINLTQIPRISAQ